MTPARQPDSGTTMDDLLSRLRRDHPEHAARIDGTRARSWFRGLPQTPRTDDFGTEQTGGRGGSYLRAQEANVQARAEGILRLLALITQGADGDGDGSGDDDGGGGAGARRRYVVDALGGNGLVSQVARQAGLRDVSVLTCDRSPYMVDAALAAGHPALLQTASHLLPFDGTMDGVLVAYGSHHIEAQERPDVAREAYRVLRPGGVFVLHDFLEGSAVDTWFSRIVDVWSDTGHQFAHFTSEEVQGYLAKAGFESYDIFEIDDPVASSGATATEAELALGRYLMNMYGLAKAARKFGDEAERWVVEQAKEIFRYPAGEDTPAAGFSSAYDEAAGLWRCSVPRRAVIGVGRKLH